MKNNLAYLLYELVVGLRIIQLAYETGGLMYLMKVSNYYWGQQ